MGDCSNRPIRERLSKTLEMTRSVEPFAPVTPAEEKQFMDELWEEPIGDFSLTDIKAINLGKPR